MPRAALRPCTYPGCNVRVERGRCPAHAIDQRPSAAKRGYDREWSEYSRAYLARPENRRCRIRTHCKGAPARVVDHIVRIREAPERKYDPTNHQPSCRTCHAAKSGRESQRDARERRSLEEL